MKRNLILIAIFIVLCIGLLQAANPRIVGQYVLYADNSIPAPSTLTLSTWFTERPTEVCTMANFPGQISFITVPGTPNMTYAIVNLACFTSNWNTAGGEHLVMHIVDTLHGNVFVEATILTTAGSNTIYSNTPVYIPWPLSVAANPTPADNATGVGITPTLTWNAVAGADSYDVYFGTTLPGTLTANVTTNAYTPAALAYSTAYQWMVVPRNASGPATGAATWHFTTMAPPIVIPPVAINPVPANNATNVAINATLGWDVVSTATSYDVYFGTTLPGTATANVTTNSWTPPAMAYSTAYQWMVVPMNSAGAAVGNVTWTFTTMAQPIVVPPVAINPVPANNATGVSNNASLGWGAVATATSYDVYFGTTLPGTVTVNVTTNSWTPPAMAFSTSYQWMVVPRNSAGPAVGNATWTFTTMAQPIVIPPVAVNPIPANNATGVFINATLGWDVVPTASIYDVYFGTTLPGIPSVTVNTNSWTPPAMAYSTTYQWMVVPRNSAGDAVGNVTWTFTTMTQPVVVPPVAVNPMPLNNDTGVAVNITLTWDATPSATSYDVYFGTTLPGTPNANITTNGWSPGMLAYNTAYQWMVVPRNSAGPATGNVTWSFTTTSAYVETLPPVNTGTTIITPTVILAGMNGNVTPILEVMWNNPLFNLPNLGLSFICSNMNYGGMTITIQHELGFIPTELYYRVQPNGWVAVTNNCNWTTTALCFSIPAAKADGDLWIALPDTSGATLPVELSSFTAILTGQYNVRLQWTTQSETNLSGYYLYRSQNQSFATAERINDFIPATNTADEHIYTYVDNETTQETTWYYWLQSVEMNGFAEVHGPVSCYVHDDNHNEIPVIPLLTGIQNIYPNPFNPETLITYGLSKAEQVTLRVMNVKGETVRVLASGNKASGTYRQKWDGKDSSGKPVGSGIYYIHLQAGKSQFTQKVVLMK